MRLSLLPWAVYLVTTACVSQIQAAGWFNTVAEYQMTARAAIFDVARGKLYMSQLGSNRVWRFNLDTGKLEGSFDFDKAPDALAMTPDGTTLSVSFPGAATDNLSYIQTVALDSATAGTPFSVPVEVTDLFVTDGGMLLTVGSSAIKSFRLGSGQALATSLSDNKARLAIDSTQTNFYAYQNPSALRHFTLNPASGQIAYPVTRNANAGYRLFLHPNGTNLISENGGIYSLSTNSAKDLLLVRQLPYKVEGIAVDKVENAFFASTGTNVHYCNATNYEIIRSFDLNRNSLALAMYSNTLVSVSTNNYITFFQKLVNPALGSTTNTPPVPSFGWSPTQPDALSPATFDAAATTDAQDRPWNLLFRWDWDGDGKYDTPFSSATTASYHFSAAGEHRVTLQVLDSQGLTTTLTRPVQVVLAHDAGLVPGTNTPFVLPFAASDAVMSPSGSHAYATDPVGKRIVEVDLSTGLMSREFPCVSPPTVLALKADEQKLYAGLIPEWPRIYLQAYTWGLVQEFDLEQHVRTRQIDLQMDPFDLVIAGDLLLGSAYSSTTNSTGYFLTTGKPMTNYHLGRAQLALHPSGTFLYGAASGRIYRWNFDRTGIINSYYRTATTGDNIWVHPDGRLVLTRAGNIYTSSSVGEEDLRFVQSLPGGTAEDICFDTPRQAFFGINSDQLSFYHSGTLELAQSFPVAQGGRFVFAGSNFVCAVSVAANATTFQLLPNPATGGETNIAPQAAFTWSPQPVGTFQTITFDASSSVDENPERLLYRWDWDADGTYDTPFISNPVAYHRFGLVRPTLVRLQVKDRYGAVASVESTIPVVAALDYGEVITNSPTNCFELTVSEAVFDPVRPYLYVCDTRSNRLARIDLLSGVIDRHYLMNHTPNSVTVTPSGHSLYVTEQVGSHGLIDVFDLQTDARTRQFEIQENPYHLIALDDLIVLASASDNATRTYRPSSGAQLSTYIPTSLAYRLTMHPDLRSFYGVTAADLYPHDLRRFSLAPDTGAIESVSDRQGNEIQACRGVFINPVGTNILNYYGHVFASSDDPAVDLSWQMTIEPKYIEAAAFVPERQVFYTGCQWALNLHDLRTLQFKHSFELPAPAFALGVYSNRLYTLCKTETNAILVSRLLPSANSTANEPPALVRINNPTNGTVVQLPGVLQLDAIAEDSDGWVDRVDYYLGSSLLGTSTNNLFSLTVTNPPAGTYSLTAVASDNWGATATSAPVLVVIQPPPRVLRNPRLLPGGFSFGVEGGANQPCVVETSTDLLMWLPVFTNSPPFEYMDERPPSSSPRFYRAR